MLHPARKASQGRRYAGEVSGRLHPVNRTVMV